MTGAGRQETRTWSFCMVLCGKRSAFSPPFESHLPVPPNRTRIHAPVANSSIPDLNHPVQTLRVRSPWSTSTCPIFPAFVNPVQWEHNVTRSRGRRART